jgi:hypothetical protein
MIPKSTRLLPLTFERALPQIELGEGYAFQDHNTVWHMSKTRFGSTYAIRGIGTNRSNLIPLHHSKVDLLK